MGEDRIYFHLNQPSPKKAKLNLISIFLHLFTTEFTLPSWLAADFEAVVASTWPRTRGPFP